MTLKSDQNFEKKFTFCLKNDKIWQILNQTVENRKMCTLMEYFCQKHVMFELKKNTDELYREK